MPRRRMSVEVIREILRLKSQNLSIRQISRSVKKGKSNVQRLLHKAEQAGLNGLFPRRLTTVSLRSFSIPSPTRSSSRARRCLTSLT